VKGVLASLEADIQARMAVSMAPDVAFPGLDCRACELHIAGDGLRAHIAYHRKQSQSDPGTFWYRTRRLHGHVLVPANTTTYTGGRLLDHLILDFAADLGEAINTPHMVASAFIRENHALMRRAGIPMRRVNLYDRSDARLMSRESYSFLLGLIATGTLMHEDFLSVYRSMAVQRRNARSTA
jgi:hypothetical protein